jgi:hypothetical protein
VSPIQDYNTLMDSQPESVLNAGSIAPDFTLPDLSGKFHSLHDFSEQIVILSFWSADCPWVSRVDEALMQALSKWGSQVSLVTIACNPHDPCDMLARAAIERRLPLVLQDLQQKATCLYNALVTPHLFLVDRQGVLRYQGAFDDVTFSHRTPTRNYLCEAVTALLAGETPPITNTPPFGCAIARLSDEL